MKNFISLKFCKISGYFKWQIRQYFRVGELKNKSREIIRILYREQNMKSDYKVRR